jgi:diadenosine tetraphosphate (Ap4A) HIT family hydrolase
MPLTLPPLTKEIERDLLESPKFARFLIFDYRPWSLFLFRDQRYLGRAYAWLTSRHVDLHPYTDLDRDERENLEDLISIYGDAVRKLWKPDLINLAWFGNEIHLHRGHGHMHFIPRYNDTPTFDGVSFPDRHFGRNYAPYDKYEPCEERLMKIRDAFREAIGRR